MALGAALLDDLDRRLPVGGVVVLTELLQNDVRSVVKLNVAHSAGLVIDVDLFEEGDERNVGDRLLVVFDPAVALRRTVVVIEGDARRDDVEDCHAAVRDRGLDQGHQLLAVAAEGAGHERAAQGQRDRAGVDRLESVDRPLLLHRAQVGGGRELALGQAVRAVVLDDVGAVDVAPDHVQELTQPDRRGVAVA